jgi:hypothetical protein
VVERQNIKRSIIASWHELNPQHAMRVRAEGLFSKSVFVISYNESACIKARGGCLSHEARQQAVDESALTYYIGLRQPGDVPFPDRVRCTVGAPRLESVADNKDQPPSTSEKIAS